MRNKRAWCHILGLLAIIVSLIFLSNLQTWAKQKGKPVKIGVLLTLTGPLAKAGAEIRNVVDMAIEDVNAKGGIQCLGGAPLQAVYGDSQAKPSVGVGETERLIERENVIAVIDMYPSVVTIAASAVAERLKTPFYAAISFADVITERGFKYVFEQEPQADTVAENQVRFLSFLEKSTGKKLSRVGLIYEDTDYGQALTKGHTKYLKMRGYQVVTQLSYPSRSSDVTSLISKLKMAKPDVVIQASYLGDSILITRTANRLGLKVPFIDSAGKAHAAYLKAVGPLCEGEFILNMWNRDISPVAQSLFERYRTLHGGDPSGMDFLDYQAILTLKVALEKSCSYDRDDLRNALSEIEILPGPNLIMPYSKIKFNENGLNIGGAFIMTQVQGGKFITVWPEKHASAKPLWNKKWADKQ
jgi:branched-chain amino acid transport system substrate-binding protein